jgi:hypothetical protein
VRQGDVDDGGVEHHHQLGGGDDDEGQAEAAPVLRLANGTGTGGGRSQAPGLGLCGRHAVSLFKSVRI